MEVGCATLLANDVRRGRIELLAALPLDVCLLFEALRRVCVCACTVQSVLKAPWGLGFVELF